MIGWIVDVIEWVVDVIDWVEDLIQWTPNLSMPKTQSLTVLLALNNILVSTKPFNCKCNTSSVCYVITTKYAKHSSLSDQYKCFNIFK